MNPEEAIEILEEVKQLDDTLYAYSWRYEKQDTVACIYEGGLSVDDNKFLLFFGAILIIIGLAGLKF